MITTDESCRQLHNLLGEFFDSYLIIGRTVQGDLVVRYCVNEKQKVEINAALKLIQAAGGLQDASEPANHLSPSPNG